MSLDLILLLAFIAIVFVAVLILSSLPESTTHRLIAKLTRREPPK